LNLSPRLRRLYPDGTIAAELYGSGDPAGLHPQEAALCRSFAPARIAEFAAGRRCARRALDELGHVDVALLTKPDRSPRWPTGVVGSITHTLGYCGAVVADTSRFLGLGLDAEIVGRVTPDLWSQVLTEDDGAQLAAASYAARARLATIIFSAKEAFYKCQFPVTEQWVEFLDVSVYLEATGADTGTFVVRPARELSWLDSVLPLPGRFEIDGNLVLTGVAITRTG
jgi:4'-phosphopantetheinyl transferase EntD